MFVLRVAAVSTAPVQVKELAFSPGIASHDLATKLKQVESWLEKKHHVRLTLRSGRGDAAVNLVRLRTSRVVSAFANGRSTGPRVFSPQDSTLEQIVQQMEGTVGFVSKPQVVRDGRAAMCVLRPPSAKELAQEKSRSKASAAAAGSDASTGDGAAPK